MIVPTYCMRQPHATVTWDRPSFCQVNVEVFNPSICIVSRSSAFIEGTIFPELIRPGVSLAWAVFHITFSLKVEKDGHI